MRTRAQALFFIFYVALCVSSVSCFSSQSLRSILHRRSPVASPFSDLAAGTTRSFTREIESRHVSPLHMITGKQCQSNGLINLRNKNGLWPTIDSNKRPTSHSRLSASNLMTVSLDKTLLPMTSMKAHRLSQAGLLVCVTVMMLTVMDYVYSSTLGEWIEERWEESEMVNRLKQFGWFPVLNAARNLGFISNTINKINLDILPLVQLGLRVVWAKCVSVAESIKSNIETTFDLNPAEEIDIKDWKVCTLAEREALPGNYMRYRFELTNPLGVLPLYIGQELQMCAVDNKDRVYKDSFFPITTSSSRGYFDIIVNRPTSKSMKNKASSSSSSSSSSSTADDFSVCLESLPIGDELAFKGGKYRLSYIGSEERIDAVTLVASGTGIAPALQVLRNVLPDQDSIIGDVEFLWINENEQDFMCNADVDALEFRYIDKLFISKVVEKDLFGLNLAKSDQVLGSFSPYKPGRIAVICAPDYFISKTRNLLLTIGYPSESILSIPI